MTEPLFDVAIIGGGVAGCASAIQLIKQGHKVVLCEAHGYPHHKVCGEFLSPECAVFLANLGLTSRIQAIRPARIHTVRITAPDGTAWEAELPGAALGISRYSLDNLMAEQARLCGVEVHDNTTVTHVHGNLDTTFKLTLRTSTEQKIVRARTVIGAHGKRSSIDRVLKRSFLNRSQPFVGLKAHFCGTALPGQIHLYTFAGGYCGLSEIEGGQVNVCLLVRQETFQEMRGFPPSNDHFIEWMKNENPALGRWLLTAQPVYQPWLSIAQIPFGNKQVVVDDVLMVGDSAGLIAPVAGDGMGMALQASQMASRLLNQYLTGQISAETLRTQYPALWWRTFGGRLRLSRVLQEFMLRPTWSALGLRLINMAPAFGRLLITHTRDNALRA